MSIPQSHQSDLPTPDLVSGHGSDTEKKKREPRLKQGTVERSESVGRNAHYISKGGVSLKSNAMTEMANPTAPMVVQRKDFVPNAYTPPIKIDMNEVARPKHHYIE